MSKKKTVIGKRKRANIKEAMSIEIANNPLNLQAVFRKVAMQKGVKPNTVQNLWYRELRHDAHLFVTMTKNGTCINSKTAGVTTLNRKQLVLDNLPIIVSDLNDTEKMAFVDMILK